MVTLTTLNKKIKKQDKESCGYYIMADFEVCKYCGKVTINLKEEEGKNDQSKFRSK